MVQEPTSGYLSQTENSKDNCVNNLDSNPSENSHQGSIWSPEFLHNISNFEFKPSNTCANIASHKNNDSCNYQLSVTNCENATKLHKHSSPSDPRLSDVRSRADYANPHREDNLDSCFNQGISAPHNRSQGLRYQVSPPRRDDSTASPPSTGSPAIELTLPAHNGARSKPASPTLCHAGPTDSGSGVRMRISPTSRFDGCPASGPGERRTAALTPGLAGSTASCLESRARSSVQEVTSRSAGCPASGPGARRS